MRSHMKKLQLPLKPQESTHSPSPTLLSFEVNSPSSSSCSSEDEGDKSNLSYILRDNPKRSIRTIDPEFSFVVDPNGSVIQDRGSETENESSKKATRKRSKRTRKLGSYNHSEEEKVEKIKSNELKTEPWMAEPEPDSSISDTTTEEDVAYWLMMLSRDKWKRHHDSKDRKYDVLDDGDEDEEEEEEEDDGDEFEGEFKAMRSRSCAKYTCETCKKVFRSYQALGGHRASHKKIKLEVENGTNRGINSSSLMSDKKIHECPVCFRVFSSGQALGGHKRTHVTTFSPAIQASTTTATKLVVENFIDLNLPAPIDEDESSQVDNSGVSDAEFLVVDGIRQ